MHTHWDILSHLIFLIQTCRQYDDWKSLGVLEASLEGRQNRQPAACGAAREGQLREGFVAAVPPFPQPRALDALALSEGIGMFSLAF